MRELELDIPGWHMQRFLMLEGADLRTLAVSAMVVDGICATVFKQGSVFKQPRLRNNGRKLFATKALERA